MPRKTRAPRRRSESARTDESLRASSFSVPVLAIDASCDGTQSAQTVFLDECGCPTLSSSPAVDAGLRSPSRLTAASAPCYIGVPRFPPRVGGVRLPRGRVTRESKRRMGRVSVVSRGLGGDRMRRRVRAPARDKYGLDGCIRVHRCRHEHLGSDDAFHRGLDGPLSHPTQPPRLSQRKRAIEGKSPMESVHSRSPRCLSGERECSQHGELGIYPERCDGRLSSSSARHRRRVIHSPDPPRAVDVAPEPPSASASSSHASSSAAAAQAPDGPVALLPSVVIRELGVDHRLETARRERPGQR